MARRGIEAEQGNFEMVAPLCCGTKAYGAAALVSLDPFSCAREPWGELLKSDLYHCPLTREGGRGRQAQGFQRSILRWLGWQLQRACCCHHRCPPSVHRGRCRERMERRCQPKRVW